MTWKKQFVLLAVCCVCSPVVAGDHLHLLRGLFDKPCLPDCVGGWCCDDYCGKKAPCVETCLSFCPDDYCAKKEPCVIAPLCFGCDDYCAKCLPPVCFPIRQNLRCAPTTGCTCQATSGTCCAEQHVVTDPVKTPAAQTGPNVDPETGHPKHKKGAAPEVARRHVQGSEKSSAAKRNKAANWKSLNVLQFWR